MSDVEEILRNITDLPLKEVLVYLVARGVKNYTTQGYEKIKKHIRDKQNEAIFAFVPSKDEAKRLRTLERNPKYREIEAIVPNYNNIDIIRTGLLIKYYHENDSPENRDRVLEIKEDISKRPNGVKLSKLVNLPSTPFFSIIMTYLHKMQTQGYSSNFLEDKFEELLDSWESSSKFVKSSHKLENIIGFCKNQIEEKNRNVFFLLGMKSATINIEKSIESLSKYFDENNYVYVITKSKKGNQPRIEVMIFKNND